jgi:hypothetical protein
MDSESIRSLGQFLFLVGFLGSPICLIEIDQEETPLTWGIIGAVLIGKLLSFFANLAGGS